jgi:hypothetical protein
VSSLFQSVRRLVLPVSSLFQSVRRLVLPVSSLFLPVSSPDHQASPQARLGTPTGTVIAAADIGLLLAAWQRGSASPRQRW